MKFRQIDLKTGQELPIPPKTVEHTYLELKIGSTVDPSKLAVGKMYDGITDRDIERLQEQGLHMILANGRSAYFGDRAIAEKVSQEIFTNHSDAVAYGSIPVSEAKTSIYKESARILIIDDETLSQDPATGTYSADWGQQPITLSNGIILSDKAMGAIASKLGDCYSLISPDLANQLQAEPDRPFQFRAGVPEWQGVFKGTCRASLLCQALEVDGIIAKSSIKGDNKTTTTGIHEVSLFWARKEDAKFTEQKLGTQALVFFPKGVQADVLPKLKIKAERLAEAQSDPRKVAQLYIEPIWYLVYMLQAFQVSRFHSFWYAKPHDPIKSLNCRINGCLKAIYFVRKDTKWVLYATDGHLNESSGEIHVNLVASI